MKSTTKAISTGLKLAPCSKKQKQLLSWWIPEYSPYADKTYIIIQGAVRSGKTMIGCSSFILWAMYTHNHKNFGIAGKSIDTLKRNLWISLQLFLNDMRITCTRLSETYNGYVLKYSYKEDETGEIIKKENYFYLLSGKDKSSAEFIQGMTAAGFFIDEATLLSELFCSQAIMRCSEPKSKVFMTCNPSSPEHWIFSHYLKSDSKYYNNTYNIHFSMFDNPSLTKETLERYYQTWDGVLHKRYILGLWVAAEGSIYTSFANNNEAYTISGISDIKEYLVNTNQRILNIVGGVDWGHNKSANTMVISGITDRQEVVVLKELYLKEDNIDPIQLFNRYVSFVINTLREIKPLNSMVDYMTIFCDSAEMMLVRGLKNSFVKSQINQVSVTHCIKHEILERISLCNMLFRQERIKINSECKNLIAAFNNAVWNEESKKDERLDDGTTNIDSLDAFEYSLCRSMNNLGYNYIERGNVS
ncbi:MAG: PBSX family phage terminase large subunit [Firmicutes bacterium]|nr:PBSX family phage terminase large subunit [Bacillota bacterium]